MIVNRPFQKCGDWRVPENTFDIFGSMGWTFVDRRRRREERDRDGCTTRSLGVEEGFATISVDEEGVDNKEGCKAASTSTSLNDEGLLTVVGGGGVAGVGLNLNQAEDGGGSTDALLKETSIRRSTMSFIMVVRMKMFLIAWGEVGEAGGRVGGWGWG